MRAHATARTPTHARARGRAHGALAKLAAHPAVQREAIPRVVAEAVAAGRSLRVAELRREIEREARADLWRIAVHEARHLAVARLLNVPAYAIGVRGHGDEKGMTLLGHPAPHRCRSGGCGYRDALEHVRRHPECHADVRWRLEQDALICLAGYEGDPSRTFDVEAALRILRVLEPDPLRRWSQLTQVLAQARQLVRQPRVRRAIEIVVQALAEQPRLRGRRLAAVVRRVDEVLGPLRARE